MTRWLYHLAFESDWEAAHVAGEYRISTRGRTLEEEGFIHLSTAAQVDGVARRFYSDVEVVLVLLTIDVTRLPHEIRLEVPPGASEAFPHLYGPLPVEAVAEATAYGLGGAPARLHHAHIFSTDIDATVDYWTTHLGARVVADEVLLGSRNVMIAVGDGRLNVYDQPPRSPDRGPVHHLGIQVRNLERLVDNMTATGISFRKPITDGEGFRYVMAEAPDGLLLELFETVDASMPPSAAGWFAWDQ
jgi:uncharacterized protein (DUF952 family)/catechol 2,3-dioxygenase-like lactoylglutathione lyase family enzyme